MPSTFSWLDYSARERKTMLTVVDLFREKGTVDELGLGRIRDAFAERFFPGTSTLQSRTRYWLFVPWLYLKLESSRIKSADAESQIRRLQSDLVGSLERGGESEGVIGIEAKDKVLRPPSVLYWAGLARYGILQNPGSAGRYHASLDVYYRNSGLRRAEGDEPELVDAGRRNWHAGLPPAPADLMQRATFDLTLDEADYLRERFITLGHGSMLAWALQHPATVRNVWAPWDHPRIGEAPPEIKEAVDHAERFSLLMHGAALVYNLAMAELAAARGHQEPTLKERYRTMYGNWANQQVTPRLAELRGWDRGGLWLLVSDMLRGRVAPTRDFAERWMTRALEEPASALDDESMRQLIKYREREMKGQLARLHNPGALERWPGESGLGRLTYRWREGKTILQDIGDGLRAGGGAD